MNKNNLNTEALNTKALRVLVIYDEPDPVRARLEPLFPAVAFDYATAPAEVIPALERHRPQVVFSMKHSGFPGETHRAAIDCPTVKWFQVGGSGYEHVTPWDQTRVTVTNGAGILAPFLAETATAAVLMLNGNLHLYRDQQRSSLWRPLDFTPLQGKRALIVGLGAIGGHLASNLKALGMEVWGLRASDTPHPGIDRLFKPQDLLSVLPQVDFVSLHLRVTPQTQDLFDARHFAAMKKGAMFLNTARGAVVVESDLVAALQSGHLGGAYLDVFASEPLPAASPLWSMDRVIITPHASDMVSDWPLRFTDFFADNLTRYIKGEALENVVT